MEGPALKRIPTASLSLPGAASTQLATPNISPRVPEDATQRCTICNCAFYLPRLDGSTEKAFILPCSHVFGNICIQRWIEIDSMHQDCPVCRRSMHYRICGHVIKACEVEKAPTGLREEDMPEKCARCRGSEDGGLEEELRESRELMLAQERALEGMRRHLPGIFGGMCRSTLESVDGRIEELRRDWGREVDAAIGELEEKEGRLEW